MKTAVTVWMRVQLMNDTSSGAVERNHTPFGFAFPTPEGMLHQIRRQLEATH